MQLSDFAFHVLAVDVALVTYRSEHDAGVVARRSSVWIHRDGRWQMRFHQGTPLP